MIRNVPALASACLFSIALGFLAGKWSAPETGASETAESMPIPGKERPSSRPDRARGGDGAELLSSILNGRGVRDIPPAELAQIIGKLSKYDADLDALTRARRGYQLQMLLAQLSAAHLEEIATAAISDKDAKQSGAIGKIIAELAGKDSDRALALVAQQGNSGALLALVISGMAETDPDKAAMLFRKGLMEGTIQGHLMWQATFGIGRAKGKLGALPLLDFVDSLPSRYRSSALYNAMGELPAGEEKTMLDELYRRERRDQISQGYLDQIFTQLVSNNPNDAGAWLESLDDDAKKASLQSQAATRLIQGGDTEAAGEWMTRAFRSSPGKEKELFLTAIENMRYNNPEDIPKLAAFLPPEIELTAADLSDIGRQPFHSGMGSLASVANAIPNPDEKAKFITTNLAQYSKSPLPDTSIDFEILSRRISEMGFTGENLQKVNQALDAARQSGNR